MRSITRVRRVHGCPTAEQVLLANNSWQSCSATTDAAVEELLGAIQMTESDGTDGTDGTAIFFNFFVQLPYHVSKCSREHRLSDP